MRVLSALILSTALALPLATTALADDFNRSISVTGTGTVEAAPDMATLMIGVTTQGKTAAEALAENSKATEAVIARLTASGVAARDMQTSNLSINPNWTGYDSSTPTISGYVASNMLTVRVRALDSTGAVLDAAVADGANTLNGMTFGLADPEPAYKDARKEAVADARAKAELLATAAGVKLGKILSISDAGAMTDPAPMYRDAVSASAAPVVGGELGLVANVSVTWEIAD
ncbi:SIMPL domain-containing protein [Tabrizicola sp.]|uniref:SIMPL domain-containing protein n=1 Tax=Tabrizicola sp. TaxID=2005166 RepID=UPI002FDF03F1